MKRTTTTLALAASMMLLAIPVAFANSENSNDTAGAGATECRPGADNGLIQPWLPISEHDFVQEIAERNGWIVEGGDIDNELDVIPEFRADLDRVKANAGRTWDFCDKNLDGTLCVMRTDPSPYYYTLLDNRPFGH